MSTIISFDPGVTTGIVTLEVEDDALPVDTTPEEFGEGLDIDEFYETLNFISDVNFPLTVVCESFILQRGSAMTSDQIAPVYLIGALQYVASQNKNITLVLQTPAEGKRAVKDSNLESLGLLRKPKTRMNHMNDAMRHAVAHLKKQLHRPTLEGGFK